MTFRRYLDILTIVSPFFGCRSPDIGGFWEKIKIVMRIEECPCWVINGNTATGYISERNQRPISRCPVRTCWVNSTWRESYVDFHRPYRWLRIKRRVVHRLNLKGLISDPYRPVETSTVFPQGSVFPSISGVYVCFMVLYYFFLPLSGCQVLWREVW